jgi:hypothetical protein
VCGVGGVVVGEVDFLLWVSWRDGRPRIASITNRLGK